jgi:hypothetical protein
MHANDAAIAVEWAHPRAAVSIAIEDFETFLRDGEALRQEHADEVGKPNRFNVPLARLLVSAGMGQIMTARAAGEMIGYLASVISPTLVAEGLVTAEHITFFVRKAFRGHAGPALLRASHTALFARGADDIILKAGIAGDGFRLDALYQRLGAEACGRLYALHRPA